MFEKETDYRKARKESKDEITKVIKVWSAREESIYDEGFKNGAEFGFNKAYEWHDLRKDPNDLPENKRNVWCDYGDGYGKGFYDKDDGGWWIEGHMFCSIIIAWCELPQFKE